MKKLIFVVLIVGVIVAYFVLRDGTTENTPSTIKDPVVTGHPDPSSATFIFGEGPVTLSNGRNEKPVAPGSAIVEETVLLDKFAYGDINADDKEDVVLFLANYGAGSGTFIYLAGYVSGPVTYRGSLVTFLGDRITPQSISIEGTTITVSYLDRKPDEAYTAEPTVQITKRFVYQNGELLER